MARKITNLAREPEKETGRLEAFSDGIFGIALTLLVLNIKIPTLDDTKSKSLLAALAEQWPIYLAFIVSFFFVLVMWINHHRLFTVIRRSDNTLHGRNPNEPSLSQPIHASESRVDRKAQPARPSL